MLKDGYLTGHICLLFSMLLFTRVRLRSRPGCTMKGSISDKLVNIGASRIDYLKYRFLYRHLSEFPPRVSLRIDCTLQGAQAIIKVNPSFNKEKLQHFQKQTHKIYYLRRVITVLG